MRPPLKVGSDRELEATKQWRQQIVRAMAYVRGDVATFCREQDAPDEASWRFAMALTQGRLDAAAASLQEYDLPDVMDLLMLYVAATSAGRQDLAEPHLQMAIDLLRASGRTERRFAQWLADEAPPQPEEVLAATVLPENKRILLAAMAAKFPGDGQTYVAHAGRLNYDRRFPHLALPRPGD